MQVGTIDQEHTSLSAIRNKSYCEMRCGQQDHRKYTIEQIKCNQGRFTERSQITNFDASRPNNLHSSVKMRRPARGAPIALTAVS